MKLLVLGGNGQLGRELARRVEDYGFSSTSLDLPQLDITDQAQVEAHLEQLAPDVVINCAAYTKVDLAEREPDLAARVNGDGPGNIAQAARRYSIRLLHISTDYVFAGQGCSSLREEDQVNPINVYGESKLQGERNVLSIWGENSLVVRTASLHGQYGPNFVHTMLDLFKVKSEVEVVSDQVMSPTWAGWLAEVLLQLASSSATGVLHAVGGGAASWYEFATEILNAARIKNSALMCQRIIPCSLSEFPRAAKRPFYSVLDCTRLTSELGIAQIRWQDGLLRHLSDLEMI